MNGLPEARDGFRDNNLLMELMAGGDQQAFAELYDEHATLVYSVCLRILADPEEARDITQTVFVTLYRKPSSFNPMYGRVAAWLGTLARNRSLDRVRRIKLQRRFTDNAYESAEPPGIYTDAGKQGVHADEITVLRTALKELPKVQRQAVELAFFGFLTHEQIAQSLAQPLGTVKARIRRGLLKLRGKCGQLAAGRSAAELVFPVPLILPKV